MVHDNLSSQLFQMMVETLPSAIRQEILSDEIIRRRWDIDANVGIQLEPNGPVFQRDTLYKALRLVLDDPNATVELHDDDRNPWQVNVTTDANGFFEFLISQGEISYSIGDFSLLSSDADTRLSWLDRTANRNLLPKEWVNTNRKVFSETALDAKFAAGILADIKATPLTVKNAIRVDLDQNRANFDQMAPKCERYFFRLVGQIESAETLADYVNKVAVPHIDQLVSQHGEAGLRQALLACGHSSISAHIPLKYLNIAEIRSTYEWLVRQGDPLSRVAAVEAWLNHAGDLRVLEDVVLQIVEAFIDQDDTVGTPYGSLSAVFFASMGEIARNRLFSGAPPFYWRHAALAHASLVVQAMMEAGLDTAGINQWLKKGETQHIAFYQSLLDLRREPRWFPEYATARQFRAEMIGRLLIASDVHSNAITSDALKALMLGSDSVLRKAEPGQQPFLPGPLEGTLGVIRRLPEKVLADAQNALNPDEFDSNSFLITVQSAYVTGDVEEISKTATEALERVDYLVDTGSDDTTAFEVLIWLSILSASARNTALAEAVRILSRVKRIRGLFTENPEDEIRIALIAAAAFEEEEKWAEVAGDWISEVCFSREDQDHASNLYLLLKRLRQLEPALIKALSKAETSLSVLSRSQPPTLG